MQEPTDQDLIELVNELDDLILKWNPKFANHNITGVLLSRVTLLMQTDPQTGKGLLQFVWQKLDELEQSDPNSYL